MSPIALPSQKAAVLHGPKDIRIEDRTIWPPSMNQAQVSIASTGLCGSDCERSSPFLIDKSDTLFAQYTIIPTEGTEISLSKHPWFLVTKQQVSSPQLDQVSTLFQVNVSQSKRAYTAPNATFAKRADTISAKPCASVAVLLSSRMPMARCNNV
jgi:hypothetical protein